ncbi:para-aminobenzoyl-glutamate transporter [Tepidanaerobacter acetatoxydans Re1]|uniref:Para-aminobenzoyl-glutamate transporter n=1 Tax=Tepidanaerobacter acetatoxydans (strain DSM 21804 / JCM 16047 / Re1) TaxID=1209989 RepID=F4LRK8_TEPAE|nr:AbgT family transporter [Tepidanaerobacter acetatoxydans]AEE90271.1 AbgT transporter [Tepidanaerobacter acetatoxydans Re1]CCP24744.1 para-aminobenzoyl-glutamate transporter [Tepidanaerobacter acetatoxydans Re1]
MIQKELKSKGGFERFLDWVERVGNKLPHPFFLFVYLTIAIMLLSAILSMLGISAINPGSGEEVMVKNLLTREGVEWMLVNALKNFTGFAPLGLVLSMQMGIGLAEQAGLLSAFMRKTMYGAPLWAISLAVMFVGINGNIASDASIVIIPTLAASIFLSLGKNPLVGLMAGYAAACAGFSANLIIAGTDALLAGITQEAVKIIDPSIQVNPSINWYFMFASTFIFTFVGAWVTEKIIAPRLGEYKGKIKVTENQDLTPIENLALKNTGKAALVFLAILAVAVLPKNAILRNAETGGLIPSPFLNGIIPILMLFFITIGAAYGKTVGTIKTAGDIPKLMAEAVKTMSGYIVLVFIIGQFVAYFNWTNIGVIIAVKGAEFLQTVGFTGLPLIIGIILLSTIVNIFIGSGSAKWSILAPIFVPMLMLLGYSPAMTQVIYRIGDSSTNPITPLFPYFPIALGLAQYYDEDAGMGTLMSLMLPYALIFLIVWILQLIVWMVLDLPLGPGAGIYM